MENEISRKVSELDLINMPEIRPDKNIQCTHRDPLIRKLWDIALDDIDRNYCMEIDGTRLFAAGGYNAHKDWDNLVFNRDTSYSGLLALNILYPNEMLAAMKAIRKYRIGLGFTCTPNMILHGVENVKVDDLDFAAFKKKYHISSATNHTDDVVWLWCADDLLTKNRIDEWKWVYETGKYCFEQLYEPFYDPTDGLYFGQATFIDVGNNGYPESFGWRTPESFSNGIWIKASSTNALYYKGLTVMAKAASLTGNDPSRWSERAERLKQSMKERMRFPDGTFVYFLHKDGRQEKRREVLGTAFPVLCGVADGEDAVRALTGYPVTAFGAPTLHPFYPTEKTLHNNSTWPFADTFLLMALEKANGTDYTEMNLRIMVNAVVNGHLGEFRNLVTNRMAGATAQLWTCAGFVNTCIRGGYTDIPANQVRLI